MPGVVVIDEEIGTPILRASEGVTVTASFIGIFVDRLFVTIEDTTEEIDFEIASRRVVTPVTEFEIVRFVLRDKDGVVVTALDVPNTTAFWTVVFGLVLVDNARVV